MKLTGLHFLLTYQCTFECDHCFVWGSPWQSGTMTLETIGKFLDQAQETGSVRSVYFEGGEPFLYYPILVKGVQEAGRRGFKTGIVTNSYWANSLQDALEWLAPFAGLISDLSVSSDLFHYDEALSQQAVNATSAAHSLGIPVGTISIAQPDAASSQTRGQLPEGESGLMYRGRAVEKLLGRTVLQPWELFSECPHEDLREPGRVHVDPLGYVHICQGIVPGNLFQTSLSQICWDYDPEAHPIIGPLLAGGPAELVRRYMLAHEEAYADACHLCYQARLALRERFPDELAPDQVYGLFS